MIVGLPGLFSYLYYIFRRVGCCDRSYSWASLFLILFNLTAVLTKYACILVKRCGDSEHLNDVTGSANLCHVICLPPKFVPYLFSFWCHVYRIYPRYSDTSTPYHICSKI